jgi:hypothetical protein
VLMSDAVSEMRMPFGPSNVNLYNFTTPITDLYNNSAPFFSASPVTASPSAHHLNPNAPEACFRLQRVGADGSLGRILFPILTDDYYLDLPHRRQIDVATLQPLIDANLGGHGFSYSIGDMTLQNVIYHSRLGTYSNVVSYRLLPNPIRKWQRWRSYPPAAGVRDDHTWHPFWPRLPGK